jgi:hypothetical protein
MSKRVRNLVALAVMALAGWIYSKLAGDWSVEFFLGFAALIAVVGIPLVAFVELPKDPYPRLHRSRG